MKYVETVSETYKTEILTSGRTKDIMQTFCLILIFDFGGFLQSSVESSAMLINSML